MRTAVTAWTVCGLAMLLGGCGDDDAASRCPPEFPVERDGYCYALDGGGRADGGTLVLDSGGAGGDSGTAGDTDGGGGGGTDGGGSGADAMVICTVSHPLVMGTRRYCETGNCYCSDPDACFRSDVADACCPGPIVCASDDAGSTAPTVDAGPGVICTSMHPNITGMGTLRWCDPGNCYCADPDACFPTAVAMACCPGVVVCY